MSRLSEDFDGEEAALKEADGFVNILKEEKTLRSSIRSDGTNQNAFDKRRHNFRQRRKPPETEDTSKRLNGCITEEKESKIGERPTLSTKDQSVNGDELKDALEPFDEMIMDIDSSHSSDSNEEDKDCILMSNIRLSENESMYPTLSKDNRKKRIPSEIEEMMKRKCSIASSDSTQSDEERDVKRSESFASFGSSVKIVQQRQVMVTFYPLKSQRNFKIMPSVFYTRRTLVQNFAFCN